MFTFFDSLSRGFDYSDVRVKKYFTLTGHLHLMRGNLSRNKSEIQLKDRETRFSFRTLLHLVLLDPALPGCAFSREIWLNTVPSQRVADRTKTMLIGAKLVVPSYLDSERGQWFMDPWTLIQSIHFS